MKCTIAPESIVIEGLPVEILQEMEIIIKKINDDLPDDTFETMTELGDCEVRIMGLFERKYPDFPDFSGWLPQKIENDILYYVEECCGCVKIQYEPIIYEV